MLALLGGAAALILTQFNPTGVSTVHLGPIVTDLPGAVAIGSLALASIAFLAAATSPKTKTGIPIVAVLVCGSAALLNYYPSIARIRLHSPPPAPAATSTPDVPLQPTAPEVQSSAEKSTPRAKTIFDQEYDPSTANSRSKSAPVQQADVHAPALASPHVSSPPPVLPHIDHAVAIRQAQAKLEQARSSVIQSLASSPQYQAAKSASDQADQELHQARQTYAPGSSELIAASKAAIDAHTAVQKIITDAGGHDPAFQEATRDLEAAKSSK
jgi:hypothetical protein